MSEQVVVTSLLLAILRRLVLCKAKSHMVHGSVFVLGAAAPFLETLTSSLGHREYQLHVGLYCIVLARNPIAVSSAGFGLRRQQM